MDELIDDLDKDGYPTDATLESIRVWRPGEAVDYRPLFENVRGVWYYPEYFELRLDGKTYDVSTGGWSGNEELIEALRANTLCWLLCWVSSRRGGHHVFELPYVK